MDHIERILKQNNQTKAYLRKLIDEEICLNGGDPKSSADVIFKHLFDGKVPNFKLVRVQEESVKCTKCNYHIADLNGLVDGLCGPCRFSISRQPKDCVFCGVALSEDENRKHRHSGDPHCDDCQP